MSITAGSRVGPYEILSPLGAGGMGAVWRARDTRLARDVAIKVLPAEFADQAERLNRFEREARLLAALNHPNVAAIYGLEVFEGAPHLVLECVEGETLAVSAGQAHPLFRDPYVKTAREDSPRSYDVSSDGSRFLVVKPGEVKSVPVTQLNLISNRTSEIERAAGARR